MGSNPSPPISLRINVFGAATYFKRAVKPPARPHPAKKVEIQFDSGENPQGLLVAGLFSALRNRTRSENGRE